MFLNWHITRGDARGDDPQESGCLRFGGPYDSAEEALSNAKQDFENILRFRGVQPPSYLSTLKFPPPSQITRDMFWQD